MSEKSAHQRAVDMFQFIVMPMSHQAMIDYFQTQLEEHAAELREALVAATPWVFEHAAHKHSYCYRGSDDGCYCGLAEAKKIVEKALETK